MAQDRTLLPSQKKQVIDASIEHGLAPIEFDWEELIIYTDDFDDPAPTISQLKHVPSGFFFQFACDRHNRRVCAYSPGSESITESQLLVDWKAVLRSVEKWLTYLSREIEAKSLLAQAMAMPVLEHVRELQLVDVGFTTDEIQELGEGLDRIEQRLLESIKFGSYPVSG